MADFPAIYCPHCKEPPTHSVETAPALAQLSVESENGVGLYYSGDTEVDWDNQFQVVSEGLNIFYCKPCGKRFGVDLASP